MLVFGRIIIAVTICCLISGCFSVKPIHFEDDKKIAMKQVENFHSLYNQGRYVEVFNMFTEQMQAKQSKEQFFAALQKLSVEAGQVKSSVLKKSDIKIIASGHLVHMFFRTDFEKNSRFEEFDCIVDGDNAKFDFYGQPEKISSDP